MNEPTKRTEFWVSLHTAGGEELSYHGYERQHVFEHDGWRTGSGLVEEKPIDFPNPPGRTTDAKAWGVSLSRDTDPVYVAEFSIPIMLDWDSLGGVTPQIVNTTAVYEVLQNVRFPEPHQVVHQLPKDLVEALELARKLGVDFVDVDSRLARKRRVLAVCPTDDGHGQASKLTYLTEVVGLEALRAELDRSPPEDLIKKEAS